MSFPHVGTSSEVTHPGASPSPSLPSEGRDVGGGSRDALVLLPEGLPLLPLTFCPVRGVEEPLDARSVHASSLLSPRFICGLGRQELLSCGGLLLPDLSQLVLPPHLCTPCEVMGGRVFASFLCSRLPLPPHLCTLCEVVRRESLPSSAPVRIPPWLPDLRLGKPGKCFEPALGDGCRDRSCCSRFCSAFRARLSGRDAVGVDHLVCCFPLRGRGAVAGGLWTACGFIAFAPVVSVWPVAVF